MEKKRVNLYLSVEVKQELDSQLKKNGMNYGNYFTHLILKDKERQDNKNPLFKTPPVSVANMSGSEYEGVGGC